MNKLHNLIPILFLGISFSHLYATTINSNGKIYQLQTGVYALDDIVVNKVSSENNAQDVRAQMDSSDTFVQKLANNQIYQDKGSIKSSNVATQFKKQVVLNKNNNRLGIVLGVTVGYESEQDLENLLADNPDIRLVGGFEGIKFANLMPKTNSDLTPVELFNRLQGIKTNNNNPISGANINASGIKSVSLDVLENPLVPK